MSKSDHFNHTLNKTIAFLLDYKPDYVQLISNITNLCKLLNLDFFQDTIQDEDENDIENVTTSSKNQRLSIAGKILVLDIDYKVSENDAYNEIMNVMLVLASNFDQFNYRNERDENIFLNNLTREVKLAKFNNNLKILKAMDDFSDVESIHGEDCFQYYQKTVNSLAEFFIETLKINKELIVVNKNDEFNITFTLNEEDILQIVPTTVNQSKRKVTKLIFESRENIWRDSEELDVPAYIGFEVTILSSISFNERMSSLFGSENFQNNKSLNFFELKKNGAPFYLSSEFLNSKFKYFWKWIFWYKNILEGSDTLTDDGESIMKNGQLLKFENEIGTWSF